MDMKGKSGPGWVFLSLFTFLAMAASAAVYSPSVTGRAISEDAQMSKIGTETGVSCELPGTLDNSGDGSTRKEKTTPVRNIPLMDRKAPEKVLTATFAMG